MDCITIVDVGGQVEEGRWYWGATIGDGEVSRHGTGGGKTSIQGPKLV